MLRAHTLIGMPGNEEAWLDCDTVGADCVPTEQVRTLNRLTKTVTGLPTCSSV